MLSRLVITFFPRSKRLLIWWLQSPSAVILEPPQNKASHCFHCFPIYLPWSDGTGCHDLSFRNVDLAKKTLPEILARSPEILSLTHFFLKSVFENMWREMNPREKRTQNPRNIKTNQVAWENPWVAQIVRWSPRYAERMSSRREQILSRNFLSRNYIILLIRDWFVLPITRKKGQLGTLGKGSFFYFLIII